MALAQKRFGCDGFLLSPNGKGIVKSLRLSGTRVRFRFRSFSLVFLRFCSRFLYSLSRRIFVAILSDVRVRYSNIRCKWISSIIFCDFAPFGYNSELIAFFKGCSEENRFANSTALRIEQSKLLRDWRESF